MNFPNIPGYEFETLLGEGGCGATYRCRFEGGGYRAVKILNGMAVNPGLLSHALSTVARLPKHPNLSPIYTYNLGQAPYYVATDYFPAPQSAEPASIRRLAGKLRPNQAWNLIEQLCGAIAFLHKHDVIHTAVKPSNVFVVEEPDKSLRLRLGDLGQGLVAGLHYYELKDSGFFASPEQLADGDFSHGKGKRWDVYSFGILSFYLLTGHLPRLQVRFASAAHSAGKRTSSTLRREDPREYFHAVQQEPRYQWPSPPKNDYESKLRGVIDRCLRLDPGERPVDLREVARDFETIRHNADLELLAKQHRAQLRGQTIRIRTLLGTTGIFLISSVLLLISAIIGFSRHMTAVAEISEAEKRRVADLSKQRSLFDEKVKLEIQLRQAAQKESSLSKEQISSLRGDLKSTKSFTDRFFSGLLSLKDFDTPGFQETRRQELAHGIDYYESFRSRYQRQPEFAAEVARAHQFLGEVKLAQGRLSDAATDLMLARDAMDRLLQSGTPDPVLLRQAALTERTLAGIEHQRENWTQMRDSLERSNLRFQQLLTREGRTDAGDLDLLTNRYELAQLDIAEGKSDQARQALDALAAQLAAQREKSPGDNAVKSLLARSLASIGSLQRRLKKDEQARTMFRNAATLLAELIQAEANVEDHQYDLASCLNHIGELEGNASMLLDAHRLLDRIARLNPSDHRYRFELARTYGKLAGIQRQEAQADQAEAMNTRALDLLASLLKEEPEILSYQYHFANQNLELARLLGDAQKFKDAVARVDQALDVFKLLIGKEKDNDEYLSTFAKALGHAGFVRKALGDKTKAKDHFLAAREAWKQLLEHLPENGEAAAGLAWIEDQLSRV